MLLLIVLSGVGLLLTLLCYGAAANRGLEATRFLVPTCWMIYAVCTYFLASYMGDEQRSGDVWIFYVFLPFILAMGYAVIAGDRKWLRH